MNRYRFLGIALLATTFTMASNLALADTKTFDENNAAWLANHNSEMCIVLGTIPANQNQRERVTIDWGAYRGQATITPRSGQSYGINLFARGNNYPRMTVQTNLSSQIELRSQPCDSEGVQGVTPSWSRVR